METQALDNYLAFKKVPDYTAEEFDVFACVSWTNFTHFVMLEIFLIAKCVQQ